MKVRRLLELIKEAMQQSALTETTMRKIIREEIELASTKTPLFEQTKPTIIQEKIKPKVPYIPSQARQDDVKYIQQEFSKNSVLNKILNETAESAIGEPLLKDGEVQVIDEVAEFQKASPEVQAIMKNIYKNHKPVLDAVKQKRKFKVGSR